MRLFEKDNVHFKIDGDINGQHIAPMLLLPFIENAFKHGIDYDPEKAWVNVEFKIKESKLFFSCVNSTLERNNKEGVKIGIGLQNVKRRLELCYPEQHHLTIDNSTHQFGVLLKINLDKYAVRYNR